MTLFLKMCDDGASKEELIKAFGRDRECIQRLIYENDITRLMTYLYWSAEKVQEVRHLIESTLLTKRQIAEQAKVGYVDLHYFMLNNYDESERKQRSAALYRQSKLGYNNPMTRIKNEFGHLWRGKQVTGDYIAIPKPDWYTGRKKQHYVYEHTVVMCKALGLTELPKGFCVHHIDGNTHNNELSNLALMTTGGHCRFHVLMRNALVKSAETIETSANMQTRE